MKIAFPHFFISIFCDTNYVNCNITGCSIKIRPITLLFVKIFGVHEVEKMVMSTI